MSEPSSPLPSSLPSSDPPSSDHARRTRRTFVLLGSGLVWVFVVLPLGALLLGWLLRDTIATMLARSALEERGVLCEPLLVHVEGAFDRLEVAPGRCEIAEGSVASIAWSSPLAVAMEGTHVQSLEVDELTVERRVLPDEPTPAEGGDSLAVLSVRVAGIVYFAYRLSRDGSPALAASRVTVSREGSGAADLTLARVQIPARQPDEPVRVTIEELTFAPITGPLGVSALPILRGVAVLAAGDSASIEGALDAELGGASIGPIQLGSLRLGSILGERRVRVAVEGLDTTARWSIELL